MEKIQGGEVLRVADSRGFKWRRFRRLQVEEIQKILSGSDSRGFKWRKSKRKRISSVEYSRKKVSGEDPILRK